MICNVWKKYALSEVSRVNCNVLCHFIVTESFLRIVDEKTLNAKDTGEKRKSQTITRISSGRRELSPVRKGLHSRAFRLSDILEISFYYNLTVLISILYFFIQFFSYKTKDICYFVDSTLRAFLDVSFVNGTSSLRFNVFYSFVPVYFSYETHWNSKLL